MSDQDSSHIDRVNLPTEKAMRLDGVLGDHRVWWAIIVVVIDIAVIVLSLIMGHKVVGIGLSVIVFITVAVLVGLPWLDGGHSYIITKLYVRWAYRRQRLKGRDYNLSRAISMGERNQKGSPSPSPPPMEVLGKVEPLPLESPFGVIGMVDDAEYDTRSVTLYVESYPPFANDQQALYNRRLATAHVMDMAARAGITRLTWQDETIIGEDINPADILRELRKGSGLRAGPEEMEEIFLRRTAEMGVRLPVHKTYWTVTVSAANDPKTIKRMGGINNVLFDRVDHFSKLLLANKSKCGIADVGILSYNDLVAVWRRRFDPIGARPLEVWRPEEEGQLLHASNAWPDTTDFTDKAAWRAGRHMAQGPLPVSVL